VAVIDGMTFDQLMDFEDTHSISLGNSVPENIASTTETESVRGAAGRSKGTEVLLDYGVQFANVQRRARAARSSVVCEPAVVAAKKILKARVAKTARSAAMSHKSR